MKFKVVLLVAVIFSGCVLQKVESQAITVSPTAPIEAPSIKQPVLVELFTSEGCSNCPAADRALAFLQREQPNSQADIITLAFHVDYWDSLGWKDEFSSPLFTQRQEFYARSFRLSSSYTPQMVVDGSYELVGSNLGKASKAIADTLKIAKVRVVLSVAENTLKVGISESKNTEDATVYLAIAEDDLATNVRTGENAGNRLEHTSVVRELKMLGKVAPKQGSFESQISLEFHPNWKKENIKLVVFVQENRSRRVLGVSSIRI